MIARAMTIAGSDCSGGAGIQADLKTFTVFQVYGMSALTALTAQNTQGVRGTHVVPADFVRAQIDAIMDDVGCDAAKTGMLATREIVSVVANAVRHHALHNLVVDPVMFAQSGALLLAEDARVALRLELIPLAALVTPNLAEAEALTGTRIRTLQDMHTAAASIIAMGARACLIKGGHMQGPEAVDVLYDGTHAHELTSARRDSVHTHGTGCQLSAAITANIARGLGLHAAVSEAKEFITMAIAHGLAIGHGAGPANPLAWRKGW